MSRKYSLAALRPLIAQHQHLQLDELKHGHVQITNLDTNEKTNWWPDSKKKTAHKQLPTGEILPAIRMATAEQVLGLALGVKNARRS